MKTNKRFGVALVAGALAMSLLLGSTQAAVIEFGTTDVVLGPDDTYSEDGFDFTVDSGLEFGIRASDGNPPAGLIVGVQSSATSGDTISVMAETGQLFTFNSFEFASGEDAQQSDSVNFRGFVNSVQTEAYDGITSSRDTFVLATPGWDAIDELRIIADSGASELLILDNFNFTVVPVPAAGWLLGSAILVIGALTRRRKMTA